MKEVRTVGTKLPPADLACELFSKYVMQVEYLTNKLKTELQAIRDGEITSVADFKKDIIRANVGILENPRGDKQ
jgi:hypothetical protein